MKIPYIALIALVCALSGADQAQAFGGYGYRANEFVRVDRCYRGHVYDYSYLFGSNKYRYSRRGCCCRK